LAEESTRKEHFEKLQAQAENQFDEIQNDEGSALGIETFKEDWNLSQFWVSESW
jgi:hypothetical protein